MYYSLYRKILVLTLITSWSWGVSGQATAEGLKVLFVGNSYTYFWNLPQTVEAMAATRNISLVVRKSTFGGTTLKQHWDGEKQLKSRELITKGDWDYVVIQNHSLSSIDDPDEFMEYGKKFTTLIRESGAKPILYMTWARKYNPLMQEKITGAYKRLAEETGATYAPVGEVWERVRMLRPDFELFAEDGSHPSPNGTYLAACVFYKVLTGKPVRGLPERIQTIDKNGEELYLSIMSKENAGFLQQVVDETVSVTEMTNK